MHGQTLLESPAIEPAADSREQIERDLIGLVWELMGEVKTLTILVQLQQRRLDQIESSRPATEARA